MKRRTAAPRQDRAQVVITAKGAERIRAGHLWVYRSDLIEVAASASGDVVRVTDQRGRFLAAAHYGAESEISLRVLTRQEEPIDRAFWSARLAQAARWRERVVEDTDAYRLVHAEGDYLPGLIIDRYGDRFSIQTLTRGMEALKGMWVELLVERYAPRLIVERNDARVRQFEGLAQQSGLLYATEGAAADEEFEITENGMRFLVDLMGGQKTGAFLDQRENRAAAMRYGGGRGLDAFSFHGSFALHLARVCEQVVAIDISAAAIDRARRNAALNEIGKIEFVEANVFDRLREYDEEGLRFETIVLDPPAFAKHRGAVEAARRGYKEINLRALRLLAPGGALITCSCSYHVSESLFLELLAEASRDAGRAVQIVEKRTQGRDHPILLTVPETHYLKCIVLRALN
jgi:23S rRNA (cytosine1962-C5)-methyltransferase